MNKILRLDHAQITVPKNQETEAKKFYCEFFGLIEIEKPENRKKNGGFWLQVGDAQVHVGLEEGVDRLKTKGHLAYQVENIGFWRQKIINNNIEISESLPFPNATAFEFRDPFGNRVEIIQYL
jgi:catechol 2,3-dioxygenase-like lactoylglutathione lyase family enzyme